MHIDSLSALETRLDGLYAEIHRALQQNRISLWPTQALALARLGDGSCTVSQFGGGQFRTKNLSYTVDRLESAGLVTRHAGADSRSRIVQATKEGKRVARIVLDALESVEEAA